MTKKEIDTMLVMSNSQETFSTFIKMASLLNNKKYWFALKTAYVHSDNLFRFKDHVVAAFSSDKPFRSSLMNKNERKKLNSLPNTIKIYRGMTEDEFNSRELGVSWSLNGDSA